MGYYFVVSPLLYVLCRRAQPPSNMTIPDEGDEFFGFDQLRSFLTFDLLSH